MALRRADIVAAAIGLLDENGLDQLSLRRLAERLGVGVSTLYWHVRDKRQLLDLMAESFAAEIVTDLPGHDDVWARAELWARSYFTTLLSHRDGARIAAGNRPTRETLPEIEQTLERFAAAGVEPAEAFLMMLTLGGYVIGVALDVQEEARRPPDTPEDEADMASFPVLAGLGSLEPTERFEYGLRAVIAGLRATVHVRR